MNETNYRQYIDGKFYYWGYGVNPDDPQEFVPPYNSLIPSDSCTGLTDKSGEKIYRGDIVQCSSGCPHEVKWYEELGGGFGGGMPGWYLSGLKSGYGKGYAWAGTEKVVGNIYETPELLEAAS